MSYCTFRAQVTGQMTELHAFAFNLVPYQRGIEGNNKDEIHSSGGGVQLNAPTQVQRRSSTL
jgi:hypothetical protein